jgi:hypothetical protein
MLHITLPYGVNQPATTAISVLQQFWSFQVTVKIEYPNTPSATTPLPDRDPPTTIPSTIWKELCILNEDDVSP